MEINPRRADVYYQRGNTFQELDDYESALADYTKATQCDGEFVDAHFNLGLLCLETHKCSQAIDGFTEVLRISSDDANARINRAMSYANLGQFEEAIRDLDKAIELRPQDTEAIVGRAMVLAFIGKYEQAQKDINRSVELGWSQPVNIGVPEYPDNWTKIETLEEHLDRLKNSTLCEDWSHWWSALMVGEFDVRDTPERLDYYGD